MSKQTKRQAQISKSPENSSVTVTEVEIHDHLGPLIPRSDELKGYEAVCPGAADRIIKLAEKQVEHRVILEMAQQKSDNQFRIIGIFVSLSSVLVFAILASIFAFLKMPAGTLAATLATPTVVFVALVLKYMSSRRL